MRWAMESMLQQSLCQRVGTDCKDLITMINEPQAWPTFVTELKTIKTLQICFLRFEISHIPRAHNGITNSLTKIATFQRELCYIDYSIPV